MLRNKDISQEKDYTVEKTSETVQLLAIHVNLYAAKSNLL